MNDAVVLHIIHLDVVIQRTGQQARVRVVEAHRSNCLLVVRQRMHGPSSCQDIKHLQTRSSCRHDHSAIGEHVDTLNGRTVVHGHDTALGTHIPQLDRLIVRAGQDQMWVVVRDHSCTDVIVVSSKDCHGCFAWHVPDSDCLVVRGRHNLCFVRRELGDMDGTIRKHSKGEPILMLALREFLWRWLVNCSSI